MFCKEPRIPGRLRGGVRRRIGIRRIVNVAFVLFASVVGVAAVLGVPSVVGVAAGSLARARGEVWVVYVRLHAVVLGCRHFLNAVNTDTPRS